MIVSFGSVYGETYSEDKPKQINPTIDDSIENFYQKYNQLAKTVPTKELPRFIKIEDKTINTQRPTTINYDVKAVDYLNKKIPVECVPTANGHVFKLGETRVHCIATDSRGIEVRGSFLVTVGFDIAYSPEWFKNTSKFWIDKQITDADYFNSISHLIKKDIVKVPMIRNISDNTSHDIPSWVIFDVKRWSENKTGTHEFSIAISWLIENGFVKVI